MVELNFNEEKKEAINDMMNDISKDEMLLRILEVSYIKAHGMNVNDDTSSLFPMGWYDEGNIDEKMKILVKATNEKKKIIEIDEYVDLQEGVMNK